jgi:hypothetical protein
VYVHFQFNATNCNASLPLCNPGVALIFQNTAEGPNFLQTHLNFSSSIYYGIDGALFPGVGFSFNTLFPNVDDFVFADNTLTAQSADPGASSHTSSLNNELIIIAGTITDCYIWMDYVDLTQSMYIYVSINSTFKPSTPFASFQYDAYGPYGLKAKAPFYFGVSGATTFDLLGYFTGWEQSDWWVGHRVVEMVAAVCDKQYNCSLVPPIFAGPSAASVNFGGNQVVDIVDNAAPLRVCAQHIKMLFQLLK